MKTLIDSKEILESKIAFGGNIYWARDGPLKINNKMTFAKLKKKNSPESIVSNIFLSVKKDIFIIFLYSDKDFKWIFPLKRFGKILDTRKGLCKIVCVV